MIGLGVNQAGAEVIRGSDEASYEYSYDDCGFIVDVIGRFSSSPSQSRVGRGEDDSFFFGHDNYTIEEIHTRRDTGAVLVISDFGLVHDVQATPVSDSVFEVSLNVVTHAKLLNEEGALLGRQDGQIRRTLLWDTLGDDTPGGLHLEMMTEDFRGNFGDIDLCG